MRPDFDDEQGSEVSQTLKVAMVGMGAVAHAVHLPILRRHPDLFSVEGICDLAPAALAHAGERFGVPEERRFTDLATMLDTVETDALLILTSGSHGDEILLGLERGAAVFTEKPLAYTLHETDLVEEALGGAPDRLMLGYMKLYDPAVEAAARAVRDRERPRTVNVTVLHPSAAAQLASSLHSPAPTGLAEEHAIRLAAQTRRLEREAIGDAADAVGPVYTGVMLGSIVHDLAVLRALGIDLHEIDHVERWPDDTHPPSLAVTARTADGVRVTIGWHYLAGYPEYREEVRWHDETGTVELVFPTPYRLYAPTRLRITSPDGQTVESVQRRSPVEAFEEELIAFHAMATDGRPPRAGVAEGRADIRTCQQMAARLAQSEKLAVGGEAGAL